MVLNGVNSPRADPRPRVRLVAEGVAWIVGLLLVSHWTAVSVERVLGSRQEIDRFAVLQAAELHVASEPDKSLWSRERIAAWLSAVKEPAPPPLAIMRIPKIHLEAPVLEGADDAVLNRGLGHIDETAMPGADGNSGIAGHRDGFFRGLKDIELGDDIELETLRAIETYRIERTWIVDPEDVTVLDPTPTRSLTLVTCYPFYFVGSAPKRFIVRAVLANSEPVHTRGKR
jgi:sortase A